MSEDTGFPKERWLREFRLNGFVILRSFLPRGFVVELAEQMGPILRGEYDRALRGESQAQRGPHRLSLDVGRYAELLGGPLADDRFRRNPIVEELVEAILGPRDRWGYGWTRVEAAWKGSEYMGWHSDQVYDETPDPDAPNRTVRVTFNVPITEFTWANGATQYLPGSHAHPRRFLDGGMLDVAHLWPAQPTLALGDCILRDGNGLHRGAPNLTDSMRAMLDQTYRTAKAAKQGS
jgi:hypothetical protein